MLLADKMDWVTFLILQDDRAAVLDAIATEGRLHLAHTEDIDTWASTLKPDDIAQMVTAYTRHKDRITQLLQSLSLQDSIELLPVTSLPPDRRMQSEEELDSALARIEAQIQPLLSKRDALQQKRDTLAALLARSEPFLIAGMPLERLAHATLLFSVTGILETTQYPRLEQSLAGIPSLLLSFPHDRKSQRILCVVLRKDRPMLEQALKEVALREIGPAETLWGDSGLEDKGLQESLLTLERDFIQENEKIQMTKAEVVPLISDLLYSVNTALLLLRIRGYCRTTENACVLSGWTPHAETDMLLQTLQTKTNGRIMVEVVAAEDIDRAVVGEIPVPVRLTHNTFFKPFEVLLDSYGVPGYRMVDPTVLMSVAFLFMFGMMFGDLGHGLVLVAGGILLARYGKPSFHNIGKLITYCGVSASSFGLLFGSVFGVEHLLPALWLHPMTNTNALFSVAITFGILIISLGVFLNLWNAIRTRSLAHQLFKPYGVLGGLIYWTGVALVVMLLMAPQAAPAVRGTTWSLIALLMLFFVKDPVLWLLGKNPHPFHEGLMAYGFDCLVEIAETIMNYLANTVSFIRVAAFGLAHAGLLVAVFELNELIATLPGGTFLSIVLLVFGNLFIILFEGAVATIQVVRLEYYEFFSKFFNDFGEKYDPVHYPNPLVKEAAS